MANDKPVEVDLTPPYGEGAEETPPNLAPPKYGLARESQSISGQEAGSLVHPRHQPSPFEVVYSGLFLVGAVMTLVQLIPLVMVPEVRQSQYTWVAIGLALCLLLQYLRMYYHLHTFDAPRTTPHFVDSLGISTPHRLADRVLRLSLASTLIVMSKPIELSHVIPRTRIILKSLFDTLGLREASVAMPNEAAALVTKYSLALVAAFCLLILWDINICRHLTRLRASHEEDFDAIRLGAQRFFYDRTETADLFNEGKYYGGFKFAERLSGFLFSVLTLGCYATETPIISGLCIASFVLFIGIFALNAATEEKQPGVVFLPFRILFEYFTAPVGLGPQRVSGHEGGQK